MCVCMCVCVIVRHYHNIPVSHDGLATLSLSLTKLCIKKYFKFTTIYISVQFIKIITSNIHLLL